MEELWSLLVSILIWAVKAYLTVRVMKFFYIITYSTYAHFFARSLDVTSYKPLWTVVTGCTDGIGNAYLMEMARRRGLRKFVLIGRNSEKLKHVGKELESEFPDVELKLVVFDFDTDDYSAIEREIADLPVGILINCAGIATTTVAGIVEQPKGLASKIVRVNLMSNVKMIESILPGMVERNQGIIVNVSSVTGWRPLPYMSSYPASKAAISFFSDALTDELAGTNVHVQCIIPLLVATKIASYDLNETNLFVIDPQTYARQAVRVMGNFRITTGCFMHDVQIAFGTLLSFWFFKQLFVPFVMLGVHKKRVNAYQSRLSQKSSGGSQAKID